MPALLGTRLGPYEILAPVGAGGMGEVYRARDTRLGREVAIKVLPPHLIDSADALARFEREARAVAALNHPNILALHDIGRQGAISYAVTELLQGETVRARIRSGPMPPRRALDALAQAARGLGAAHERGIVHRDIKPENLFLTSDGRVKILDFGLAIHADGAASHPDVTTAGLTEPGMLVGTPSYMAPEQLLTQVATPRSDLFAFGLVAHEILTGVHPFKRPTPGETTMAILREEPAPLGPVSASLPPGVAPVLARCLEKQPADRPGSARDLAFFLETLSAAPEIAGNGHRDVGPRVRRRVLLTSIGVLLSVVLLTSGYVGFMTERVVTEAVESHLARASRLVHRVQDERLTRLELTGRMIASFPELKALFETGDSPTIGAFLQEQRAALPGTPTLVALLPDGRVLARTDSAGGAAPAAPGDT
ncbi:MAG: serine/threonine-protein kinase, partial [Vicinamibacterales bacterium]